MSALDQDVRAVVGGLQDDRLARSFLKAIDYSTIIDEFGHMTN
jgi:hypothetical protein